MSSDSAKRSAPSATPQPEGGGAWTPASGRGPGVVVLAPAAASTDLVADAGSRLAHHGFVALAASLPAAEGGDPGAAERSAVDDACRRIFELEATEGSSLGLLGFGRGGVLALDAAARGSRAAIVITVDGAPQSEEVSLATLDARVLALFAGKGAAASDGRMATLERRLRAEGVTVEIRVVPGVGEDFLDPAQADRFDAVGARTAWDAVLSHLRAELS